MLKLFKKKRVRDYLEEENFKSEIDKIIKEKKDSEPEKPKSEPDIKISSKDEPAKLVRKADKTIEEMESFVEESVIEDILEAIPEYDDEEVEKKEPEVIEIPEKELITDEEALEVEVEEEVTPEPVKEELSPKEAPIMEKEPEVKEEQKESLFDRLSKSLSKTKNSIIGKINTIISENARIDDDTLDEIEEALYTSDIGVKTCEIIIENIRERVSLEKYEDSTHLKTLIQEEIAKLVKTDDNLAKADFSAKPYVILVVGVNGNGKTTTIGKLAHFYKNMGKKVLIGAADTFRAAAIEQLETWANRAGVDFVKDKMDSDPAAVAYNAYQAALARDMDVVLIDTGGRLHNKVNHMKELEKITRVLKKLNPDAPHESLLVLDATTGQNAVSQAKQFNLSTGVTGLVLTKLDGTAKGGVAISINQELSIPIKFIGVGEKITDLQIFQVEDYVKAIFS